MTEAKVLADALVEAGILTTINNPDGGRDYYILEPDESPDTHVHFGSRIVNAVEAITDWRVAGKVLELMAEHGRVEFFGRCTNDTFQCSYRHGNNINAAVYHGVDPDPCRAIIEAWYEVQNND